MSFLPSDRWTSTLPDDEAAGVAAFFAALGYPIRFKIVAHLARGEPASVQELAEAVGDRLTNVSKHLQVLHQSGVVSRTRTGTYVHYRLADEGTADLVAAALDSLERGAVFSRPPFG